MAYTSNNSDKVTSIGSGFPKECACRGWPNCFCKKFVSLDHEYCEHCNRKECRPRPVTI